MVKLEISKIATGGNTQSRDGTNGPTVYEYAERMKEGDKFPPIIVYHDDGVYWLADGFHRVAAAKEAGFDSIDAHIRQGTRRDAVLYSVSANISHGLQPTLSDKRKAARMLLEDAEWGKKSNREIAKLTGLTHPTVEALREKLAATGKIYQSDERTGADGRTINTAKIGGKQRDYDPDAVWKAYREYTSLKNRDGSLHLVLYSDSASLYLALNNDMVLQTKYHMEVGNFTVSGWGNAVVGVAVKMDASFVKHLRETGTDIRFVGMAELSPEMRIVAKAVANARFEVNRFYNPYKVGDAVLVGDSDVVGEVTEIGGNSVRVTRPNPNGGSNMTHWVKTSKVKPVPQQPAAPALAVGDKVTTRTGHEGVVVKADDARIYVETANGTAVHKADKLTPATQPAAQQPPQAADTSMSNEYARAAYALERLMTYAIGESPLYPDILKDVEVASDWFDLVRTWALQPESVS